MREIVLTNSMITIVDDEDYESLSKYKWWAAKPTNNNNYYASRKEGRKQILMHRQILGLTDPNIKGDHRDRNTLNNQRNNLRPCTPLQNGRNKSPHKNSASKYLGVVVRLRSDYDYKYKYWKAQIRVNDKIMPSKQFPFTEEGEVLAAKAYDEMAKKYFGEFANLNFPEIKTI